jgi:hypothetical protein
VLAHFFLHRVKWLAGRPLTAVLCDNLVVDLMTEISLRIKKRRAAQHRSSEPVDKALKELEDQAEQLTDRVLMGKVPGADDVYAITNEELARGLMNVVKDIVWQLAKA